MNTQNTTCMFQIAHILGRTRGMEEQFRHVERVLTLRNHCIVFTPVVYELDLYNHNKEVLDAMCYQKLQMCDFCVVLSEDSIGKSTLYRIIQAHKLGKPVYVWDMDTDTMTRVNVEKYIQEEMESVKMAVEEYQKQAKAAHYIWRDVTPLDIPEGGKNHG